MSHNETSKHGFDNPNYDFSKNRELEEETGIELTTRIHAADSKQEDENEITMESNVDDILDNNDKSALMKDDKSNIWYSKLICYKIHHPKLFGFEYHFILNCC